MNQNPELLAEETKEKTDSRRQKERRCRKSPTWKRNVLVFLGQKLSFHDFSRVRKEDHTKVKKLSWEEGKEVAGEPLSVSRAEGSKPDLCVHPPWRATTSTGSGGGHTWVPRAASLSSAACRRPWEPGPHKPEAPLH